MEHLRSLFIIYLLFIFLSLITGAGVYLLDEMYAHIITGVLLIISSITILTIFIKQFVYKPKTKFES